jgi:ribonuclease HI
MGVILMSP